MGEGLPRRAVLPKPCSPLADNFEGVKLQKKWYQVRIGRKQHDTCHRDRCVHDKRCMKIMYAVE